ncbi:uncharacterized protein [Euwallacea fornicatus]|uniref:uncharacterized protein n=1 Tax=Euwallacea fornicatus TaxID=995702 RepID=UPI00338EF4D9
MNKLTIITLLLSAAALGIAFPLNFQSPVQISDSKSKETNSTETSTNTTTQKEAVSTTLDTPHSGKTALVKLFHRIRRAYEGRSKYIYSNDYYNERDQGGYNRKKSDVGYLDRDDDFPTVVW